MAVPKRKGGADIRRILRTPGPTGRATRIVAVLFALYVAELLAQAAGLPVMELARAPMSGDPGADLMGAWRNLTSLLIERPLGQSAFNVLIALVVTYFTWPSLEDQLGIRRLAEALAVMAAAGLIAANCVDALGAYGGLHIGRGVVLGWSPLLLGAFCVMGLSNPNGQIRVNFVLPVPMWVFVWGSLALALLQTVAAFGSGENILDPIQKLGIWLGAYGWYAWRGPGARRRYLKTEAKKIERELTRLRVLPGGKDDNFH